MMVVHEDNVNPVEIAVIRKPRMEQTSYVIVKNHVRELINTDATSSKSKPDADQSPHTSQCNEIKSKRKADNKLRKTVKSTKSSTEIEDNTLSESKIYEKDLEELRRVYKNCKEVIRKIENKYGHLLSSDIEVGTSFSNKKRKLNTDSSSDRECNCKPNKKIVFDEDGKQSTIQMSEEKHICVKKQPYKESIQNHNISIEYNEQDYNLPDNLQELGKMLHDPNLDKMYRHKILEKVRSMKQEYINEIKFNKHVLIEKLKSNPEDVLDFKGTNLSTMPGYS